ncbi:MAG TPA: hypothetical protein VIY97_00885 [Candidatus Methanoperedens sp.]
MVKGGNTNLLIFSLLNGWVHQLKNVVKCAAVQGLYKSIMILRIVIYHLITKDQIEKTKEWFEAGDRSGCLIIDPKFTLYEFDRTVRNKIYYSLPYYGYGLDLASVVWPYTWRNPVERQIPAENGTRSNCQSPARFGYPLVSS